MLSEDESSVMAKASAAETVIAEMENEIARLRSENEKLRAALAAKTLRAETVEFIRSTMTDYREELRETWEGRRDYLIADADAAIADLNRAYPEGE